MELIQEIHALGPYIITCFEGCICVCVSMLSTSFAMRSTRRGVGSPGSFLYVMLSNR